MNSTILTHFYNEEFLLPLWLNHHRKFFESGILFDYGSTDRSVEIIRDICPHWQVRPSKNIYFDHIDCDIEIMEAESQLNPSSFRTSITCTEFIVGNIMKVLSDVSGIDKQVLMPVNYITGYDPNGILSNKIPLWEQIKIGVPWQNVVPRWFAFCRSLHNFNNMKYTHGRHFKAKRLEHITTEIQILKVSNVLVGQEMIKRRLQTNAKISPRSRKTSGVATQHTLTEDTIEAWYNYEIIKKLKPFDISDRIEKLTSI